MDEYDLFERHEDMPAELQAVTSKYSEILESGEIDRYEVCKQFLADVETWATPSVMGWKGSLTACARPNLGSWTKTCL